jgi:hypothetical protein
MRPTAARQPTHALHAHAVEITGSQKEQVQLCQLYLEGTFEHMQPPASSPGSAHTQLGSSSALAQRYCLPRSPSGEAASPSAGNASLRTPFVNQTPAAMLARAQQQEESRAQQQQEQRYRAPPAAAAAASTAAATVDAIHYHLLSERVARIESAVATMATTVAQLVQLLSVAAESSPQAAAAIWSTAAQLTAVEAPAALSSNCSTPPDDSGAGADCHPEAGGLAAPEFNLRRRIVRVADVHERLCALPSGLPAHEAVTVTRH